MPVSPPKNFTASEEDRQKVILATSSYDHDIKLWQAHTGLCERTLQHSESQVNALEITPDCQLLAAAGHQHIRMYDLNSSTSDHIINYDGISKNVTALGFQENGKWMYTGGEDGTAKIWDLRSKNLHISKIFKVDTPVNCVCLHPNQVDMFVGDQAGVIHIWDVNSTNNENDPLVPDVNASIQHLAVDAKGMFLAAITNKGKVYIWRLKGGTEENPITLTPIRSLAAHAKYGLKVKFSPDSSLMATTSADTKCTIWRTKDFSKVIDLTDQNQRWVWDVTFSSDSKFVVTGSSDSTARLWSISSGKVVREYSGHRKAISALAFRDTPLY
ncbi:Target of rapamycin complex subunit lst8 [Armadillidium nasatum]|uniref:Target of rapamycin complex subunit lst8 n=1 Tax=Armadillidium nasatum TaxID=96803 RepID=A0A5N5STX4_9CRUS|nr:Target of rapamycin complex subunit lst8 [Armadillidium nasatum]